MSIRTAASLAIVGLLVRFVLRTGNTIWPSLFDSSQEASSVALTFVVSNVLVLTFYVTVRAAARGGAESWLARASGLAGLGTLLVLLVDIRFLLAAFGAGGALLSTAGETVAATVVALAALAGLWFLGSVHAHRRGRLPTGAALAGAAFFALLACLGLGFQVSGGAPAWFLDAAGRTVRLLVVIGIVAFAAVIRFLVAVRGTPTALVGEVPERLSGA